VVVYLTCLLLLIHLIIFMDASNKIDKGKVHAVQRENKEEFQFSVVTGQYMSPHNIAMQSR